MPAFFQIEARRYSCDCGALFYPVVRVGNQPIVKVGAIEAPTPFTREQFDRVVADLVAKGYEVRLAR